MNLQRKNWAFILSAVMAVQLVACSQPQNENPNKSTTSVAESDTLARRRPVFNPQHPWAHDPVIAQEGDTVYVFTTGHGISQMHTVDMTTWEPDGPVLEALPEWVKERLPEATMHLWAPDILYAGGKWHLYYTCSVFAKNTSLIGHLTATTLNRKSPKYGWKDEGMIVQSVPHRDNWNAIDPNAVVCTDGSAWLTFGSFWGGIKLVRLTEDLSAVAQPEEWHSVAARQRLELSTNDQPGDAAIEAPFIYQHGGWFYLFVSFDYCCRGEESTYHMRVGRAKDVRGPYVDRSGQQMEFGGGTKLEILEEDVANYVAAGHCGVGNIRGKDVIVYHGYTREDGHSELVVRQLAWDNEEWPQIQPL